MQQKRPTTTSSNSNNNSNSNKDNNKSKICDGIKIYYEKVREQLLPDTATKLGIKRTLSADEANILWHATDMLWCTIEEYKRVNPEEQRMTCIPGMQYCSAKSPLSKILSICQPLFSSWVSTSNSSSSYSSSNNNNNNHHHKYDTNFDFYPRAFSLPSDWKKFKAFLIEQKNNTSDDNDNNGVCKNNNEKRRIKTWIMKQNGASGGRNISLMSSDEILDNMNLSNNNNNNNSPENSILKSITSNFQNVVVAQEYFDSPLLLDKKKTDMRIYVLVTSVIPLRFHIFKQGYVRVACDEYETPTTENIKKTLMHVINRQLFVHPQLNNNSNNNSNNKNKSQDQQQQQEQEQEEHSSFCGGDPRFIHPKVTRIPRRRRQCETKKKNVEENFSFSKEEELENEDDEEEEIIIEDDNANFRSTTTAFRQWQQEMPELFDTDEVWKDITRVVETSLTCLVPFISVLSSTNATTSSTTSSTSSSEGENKNNGDVDDDNFEQQQIQQPFQHLLGYDLLLENSSEASNKNKIVCRLLEINTRPMLIDDDVLAAKYNAMLIEDCLLIASHGPLLQKYRKFQLDKKLKELEKKEEEEKIVQRKDSEGTTTTTTKNEMENQQQNNDDVDEPLKIPEENRFHWEQQVIKMRNEKNKNTTDKLLPTPDLYITVSQSHSNLVDESQTPLKPLMKLRDIFVFLCGGAAYEKRCEFLHPEQFSFLFKQLNLSCCNRPVSSSSLARSRSATPIRSNQSNTNNNSNTNNSFTKQDLREEYHFYTNAGRSLISYASAQNNKNIPEQAKQILLPDFVLFCLHKLSSPSSSSSFSFSSSSSPSLNMFQKLKLIGEYLEKNLSTSNKILNTQSIRKSISSSLTTIPEKKAMIAEEQKEKQQKSIRTSSYYKEFVRKQQQESKAKRPSTSSSSSFQRKQSSSFSLFPTKKQQQQQSHHRHLHSTNSSFSSSKIPQRIVVEYALQRKQNNDDDNEKKDEKQQQQQPEEDVATKSSSSICKVVEDEFSLREM